MLISLNFTATKRTHNPYCALPSLASPVFCFPLHIPLVCPRQAMIQSNNES